LRGSHFGLIIEGYGRMGYGDACQAARAIHAKAFWVLTEKVQQSIKFFFRQAFDLFFFT